MAAAFDEGIDRFRKAIRDLVARPAHGSTVPSIHTLE
jgi:hypothetical protein